MDLSRMKRMSAAADNGWKDELNLAEFPIAALTDRVPNGQTTLVFEDKLERRDSPPIVRRLTIMGTRQARPADRRPTTRSWSA